MDDIEQLSVSLPATVTNQDDGSVRFVTVFARPTEEGVYLSLEIGSTVEKHELLEISMEPISPS